MLICLLTCSMLPTLNTVEAGMHRGVEGSGHLAVKDYIQDYIQDDKQVHSSTESEKWYMISLGTLMRLGPGYTEVDLELSRHRYFRDALLCYQLRPLVPANI